MKKAKMLLSMGLLALTVFVGVKAVIAFEGELLIEVSPKVVNLASESTWVTVHTNVPYDEYLDDTATLKLGNVIVDWTKEDNLGQLVAKFDASLIKDDLVLSDLDTLVTFTYEGEGLEDSATDTIEIIDVTGNKVRI